MRLALTGWPQRTDRGTWVLYRVRSPGRLPGGLQKRVPQSQSVESGVEAICRTVALGYLAQHLCCVTPPQRSLLVVRLCDLCLGWSRKEVIKWWYKPCVPWSSSSQSVQTWYMGLHVVVIAEAVAHLWNYFTTKSTLQMASKLLALSVVPDMEMRSCSVLS